MLVNVLVIARRVRMDNAKTVLAKIVPVRIATAKSTKFLIARGTFKELEQSRFLALK